MFADEEEFARYCDLFPTDHSVQSYVRWLAIIQWDRKPWVDKQVLHRRSEHLKTFRALKSLILRGITNGSMQGYGPVEALAEGFETIAPQTKTMKLVQWKVSPITLIEFICRFPSLDNLVVEDMHYVVGLQDRKHPFRSPRFAGRFRFTDSKGRGPSEKFLCLLSRLPLGFREISIDVGFSGAPDPIIMILEKCSPVLVKARLYYGYHPGMATAFLSFYGRIVNQSSTTVTNFLGSTIREINASFPELRELTLRPDVEDAGIVDDLALKLLSVISSPHLSHVTLDHTVPHSFDQTETNKWREVDRTMFKLTQRIGRKVSFSWHFPHEVTDVERVVRPWKELTVWELCVS